MSYTIIFAAFSKYFCQRRINYSASFILNFCRKKILRFLSWLSTYETMRLKKEKVSVMRVTILVTPHSWVHWKVYCKTRRLIFSISIKVKIRFAMQVLLPNLRAVRYQFWMKGMQYTGVSLRVTVRQVLNIQYNAVLWLQVNCPPFLHIYFYIVCIEGAPS